MLGRLRVSLDRDAPAPLYRQLETQLRAMIERGLLTPGGRLPAIRELATQLGVGTRTVIVAYEELAADGLVAGRVGSGTWVADRGTRGHVWPRPGGAWRRGDEVGNRDHVLEGAVDLTPEGGAGSDEMRAWQRSLRARAPLHDVAPASVHARLKKVIAEYLGTAFGLTADSSTLHVASCQALGSAALLTWTRQRASCVSLGPAPLSIHRASDLTGVRVIEIDPDSTDPWPTLPTPYLIVVDSHRLRLIGCALSPLARRRMYRLAVTGQAQLVEFDESQGVTYGEPDPVLLMDLDALPGTAYCGRLPGLPRRGSGLSWAVVPAEFGRAFGTVLAALGDQPSLVEQAGVAEFFEAGHAERLVRRARRQYPERRSAAVSAIRKHLEPRLVPMAPPFGGDVLLRASSGLDVARIVRAALREHVMIAPTWHDGNDAVQFRFAHLEPDLIQEACLRLRRVIDRVSGSCVSHRSDAMSESDIA